MVSITMKSFQNIKTVESLKLQYLSLKQRANSNALSSLRLCDDHDSDVGVPQWDPPMQQFTSKTQF